ncbi:MAG TPA: ribose-phosphate pyrophosphokinase [Armatimonadota bacterium]|nr:ribose-phosphate pyrophosphokinase [Armatimonadota bacterium]HOM81280.1 ribose-phosphate pyrophosphokinase [Armatimonadota bacterium]HPO73692.1 ribose-phosphate pyrophosphokinase [Armatimonadota bacterium]HPT99270.1 ribose-phosphate pyrophosphokinase [Armatimonadota bacterium]
MKDNLKIFSGSSNPELAEEICRCLDIPLGRVVRSRFANDNLFIQIEESVRECDVFVVQSSCPPVSEGIVELLILIDALRSASASRITAVLPYYPYVRSDKKDQPRISITAKLMAQLLRAAGAGRVLTMTLHSPQIQGFFDIPVDHLQSTPVLCSYYAQLPVIRECVAVAPDAGSAKRAGSFAQRLDIPLAFVDKRRLGNTDDVASRAVVGDVRDKHVIIFDDEISTAGSLMGAVDVLKNAGAREIYVGCTHGVLCGPAIERIAASPVKEVVVTNTVPLPPEKRHPKIKTLSVAPLFAEAIKRTHTGQSIHSLFL